jgi:hypothetical protein
MPPVLVEEPLFAPSSAFPSEFESCASLPEFVGTFLVHTMTLSWSITRLLLTEVPG